MSKLSGPILAFLSLMLPACVGNRPGASAGFFQAETAKAYPDVLAELQLAITEHNFRITGHNKIGSVIRERDGIPFPDYDSFQFCNLTHAREMLEIDPAAVIHMPCSIAVRSERGKVIVTTHLLPTDSPNARMNAFAMKINEELKQIVRFAADD